MLIQPSAHVFGLGQWFDHRRLSKSMDQIQGLLRELVVVLGVTPQVSLARVRMEGCWYWHRVYYRKSSGRKMEFGDSKGGLAKALTEFHPSLMAYRGEEAWTLRSMQMFLVLREGSNPEIVHFGQT